MDGIEYILGFYGGYGYISEDVGFGGCKRFVGVGGWCRFDGVDWGG